MQVGTLFLLGKDRRILILARPVSKIKALICTIIDFHPWVCTERTVSILRGVATDFGVPIEPTFSAYFYITQKSSLRRVSFLMVEDQRIRCRL